jgi:hypothetical protein
MSCAYDIVTSGTELEDRMCYFQKQREDYRKKGVHLIKIAKDFKFQNAYLM